MEKKISLQVWLGGDGEIFTVRQLSACARAQSFPLIWIWWIFRKFDYFLIIFIFAVFIWCLCNYQYALLEMIFKFKNLFIFFLKSSRPLLGRDLIVVVERGNLNRDVGNGTTLVFTFKPSYTGDNICLKIILIKKLH